LICHKQTTAARKKTSHHRTARLQLLTIAMFLSTKPVHALTDTVGVG